jgi:hypothetical protein
MRYDKYNPVGGGFRALLAANWTGSDDPFGVGLDADGHVVKGAGVTGVVGVMIKTQDALAGQVVDVMKLGEIVEFDGDPATIYYAHGTTGVISDTASDFPVGFTVEETRLFVAVTGGTGGPGGVVVGNQTSIVALTDSTGADAGDEGTVSAVPVPTDTPASADALRDDIATNLIPVINENFSELVVKVNEILSTLDAANVTA